MSCASVTLVLILAAAHPWSENKYESFTPGIGGRCDKVEVGIYRNSNRDMSSYGGYHFEVAPKTSIMLGFVTGYDSDPLPAFAVVSEILPHTEIVFIPPFEIDKHKVVGVIGFRVTW